jgi:hypothetical protein
LSPPDRAFGFDTSTGLIPRLDRACGIMSVPDNALTPVRQFEIGLPGEERRELRLDRLLDQPFRAAQRGGSAAMPRSTGSRG